MGRPKASEPAARERLLEAAGRGFRAGGYGGIGVDALAKQAGLTSGAFYSHFGSKADAFCQALTGGLQFFRRSVQELLERKLPDTQETLVDFYFGERMEMGLEEACALATLTTDASRADAATRAAYELELSQLAATIAESLNTADRSGMETNDAVADRRRRAWVLMAIFSGGSGMARAVSDPALRAEILQAVSAAAKRV
jgi:TetR/AcrR family transcriptional regulator, transcriptional repressor for nem operon